MPDSSRVDKLSGGSTHIEKEPHDLHICLRMNCSSNLASLLHKCQIPDAYGTLRVKNWWR